jgi:putative redox protein
MKVRIKWTDQMTFLGETGSGHGVVIDSAPEVGGRNLGGRPMEMVLLGLGSCSAVDVMLMLHKSRQQVDDCVVEVDAERADDIPKVFTRIHLHYIVTGKATGRKQLERAVSLSPEKYCSVSRMLAHTAEITHDFEVIET